ncbi:mpv17 / PMP22 family domain-containing protein [Phthorimaea operculella]|nr:mpv17 / PMP22 family domain-containing protein [Phthorimaea operculella]
MKDPPDPDDWGGSGFLGGLNLPVGASITVVSAEDSKMDTDGSVASASSKSGSEAISSEAVAQCMIEAADQLFPIKNPSFNKIPLPPWWDRQCSEAVKSRKDAEKVYAENMSDENLDMLTNTIRETQEFLKNKKQEGWRAFCASLSPSTCPSEVWLSVPDKSTCGTFIMTYRRVFTKVAKNYKSGVDILFGPKYLFYTNVLLSMTLSTVGDVLEQSYEKYNGEITQHDYKRTAHMGFSGSTTGVLSHHWYNFIDKVIKERTLPNVFKKLMLDQFIASPIIIMTFFATVAIFEDDPLENFTSEVKDKFLRLYKAEWVIWPPAQLINFYFLPTRFRVLYDNTISLGYDIYTSKVKHEKKPPGKETKS